MSPEQMVDARKVDARSDVWALGCTAYRLLTGVPPFDGRTLPEICTAVLGHAPVPADRIVPEIPRELAQALTTALAKSREHRFASVQAFGQAIERFARPIQAPTARAPAALTAVSTAAASTAAPPTAAAPSAAAAASAARSTVAAPTVAGPTAAGPMGAASMGAGSVAETSVPTVPMPTGREHAREAPPSSAAPTMVRAVAPRGSTSPTFVSASYPGAGPVHAQTAGSHASRQDATTAGTSIEGARPTSTTSRIGAIAFACSLVAAITGGAWWVLRVTPGAAGAETVGSADGERKEVPAESPSAPAQATAAPAAAPDAPATSATAAPAETSSSAAAPSAAPSSSTGPILAPPPARAPHPAPRPPPPSGIPDPFGGSQK
jgi:serine/threonine-protein kinase